MSYAIGANTVTREEWLEARRSLITASDIGAILGLNPYKSRTDLWLEKKGLAAEKEETGAMWLGRELEAVTAKWWAEKAAQQVTPHGRLVVSECGRFGATPDFIVIEGEDGRGGLLETKTSVERAAKAIGFDPYQQGTDRVPESYLLQCQWQMFVCGVNVCHLALLVLDARELWCYEIRRNTELIVKCVIAAEQFLEELKSDDMPEITGDHPRDLDTLKELYPQDDGEVIHATEEDEVLLARFEVAYHDYKRAESEKAKIEALLKTRMSSASTLLFGDGFKRKISWKLEAGRTDWASLALNPVLTPEQIKSGCLRPTTEQIKAKSKAPSRVLRHPFKAAGED